MDGAVKYDGIVTFITTNNIDTIDSALGGGGNTRPGRIDYVYEMTSVGEEGREFIGNKIFANMDGKEEMLLDALTNSNAKTPAQFKEYCINSALENYDVEVKK